MIGALSIAMTPDGLRPDRRLPARLTGRRPSRPPDGADLELDPPVHERVRHPRLERARRRCHPHGDGGRRCSFVGLAAVLAADARSGRGGAARAGSEPRSPSLGGPLLRRSAPRPMFGGAWPTVLVRPRAASSGRDRSDRPSGDPAALSWRSLMPRGTAAMRDYDCRRRAPRPLPAGRRAEPPPGVHMPAASFRPILASIAFAVVIYGLVFGGWLLTMGLIMVVVSLVGWLRDARAEYVLAEAADVTGHLDSLPAPRVPTGTIALFGALFVLGIILNSGIIPNGSASGATGGSPAPGGSATPGGSAAPGGSPAPGGSAAANLRPPTSRSPPRASSTTPPTLTSTAGQPFTIAFVNKDAGIPHDIEVADAGGAILFEGATITGVSSTVYSVPPLKAGDLQVPMQVAPEHGRGAHRQVGCE